MLLNFHQEILTNVQHWGNNGFKKVNTMQPQKLKNNDQAAWPLAFNSFKKPITSSSVVWLKSL